MAGGLRSSSLDTTGTFTREFDLSFADLDGCAFGRIDENGNPVREPWRFATNCQPIHQKLNGRVRPGGHTHTIAAGRVANGTGSYPKALAMYIHAGYRDARGAVSSSIAQVTATMRKPDARFKDAARKHTPDVWKGVSSHVEDYALEPRVSKAQVIESGHRVKLRGEVPMSQDDTGFMNLLPDGHNSLFLPPAVHARVPRSQWSRPGVKGARDKEWKKLENAPWPNGKGKGAWDLTKAREMGDVRREDKRTGMGMHFVRMHGLCFDRNAELPVGDPPRKYKGRSVLLGNVIRDENVPVSAFADIASAPATIEAARALDAYSCIGDNMASQSDVTSAHTQCFLRGKPTWSSFPKGRWPEEWHGEFLNPVMPPSAEHLWPPSNSKTSTIIGLSSGILSSVFWWSPMLRTSR